MDKLTDAQIMAADAILEMCNINGSASPFRVLGRNNDNSWGLEIDEIIDAADFLIKVGIIKPISTNVKDGHVEYMFTSIGEKEYIKGKRTVQYLQEEADKEAKQLEKDNIDLEIKRLQRDDLQYKVTNLNPEQYQSYTDFWKRHWMTIFVSVAALIIAILAFVLKK